MYLVRSHKGSLVGPKTVDFSQRGECLKGTAATQFPPTHLWRVWSFVSQPLGFFRRRTLRERWRHWQSGRAEDLHDNYAAVHAWLLCWMFRFPVLFTDSARKFAHIPMQRPETQHGDSRFFNWSLNNEAPSKAPSKAFSGRKISESETKTSVILQVEFEKTRISLCSHFWSFISIPTSEFWMLPRPNVFMFPCALKATDLAEDLFGNWRKLMKAPLFKSVLYRENQSKSLVNAQLMESFGFA